ncbi:MAG: alpha amylase N-terminal ig-like domain-containing protein, partial [Streptococcaceae bacterium]|nr:alpha amylase N-terminal ig-like domain-containing protein [Streptococcaceae bacterium]
MNRAAIYHRPESEYAFMVSSHELKVRIRTAVEDIHSIEVVYGDPYEWMRGNWLSKSKLMDKSLQTDVHQYWSCTLTEEKRRLNYGFILI